jgi:hypothetical protein
MKKISYKDITKYKFILTRPYSVQIPIYSVNPIEISGTSKWYARLDRFGILTINEGYAWDGASGGVTIQDDSNRRASLVHDVLYQLKREGKLPDVSRQLIDKVFYEMLLEDGMNPLRARYYYLAVRTLGGLFV